MRISPAHLTFLLTPLLLIACADADSPTATAAAAPGGPAMAAEPGPRSNFRANLSGGEEVPSVDTRARGQAVFQLSADGTELSYRLIVANIEDVLMAHIHRAPAGVNGGVVVWLYPAGPPPQLIEGRFSGVLATGVITADDLVGTLAGQSLEALVAEMQAGGTYVNVHTVANPGGEVRGQIH